MIYYMQVTQQLACGIFHTIVNLFRQKEISLYPE